MTREEAIEQLQNCIDLIKQDGQDYLDDRDIPLLDMAIKALQTDEVVIIKTGQTHGKSAYIKELAEVVRCKDCKHWYADADTGMACEFTNMGQPEDGYCNWGERKGGDDE